MSKPIEMKEWLEGRFPVDGRRANAWTIAESETQILAGLGGREWYASVEDFHDAFVEYIDSIGSGDLPEQPKTRTLQGQWRGGYAGTKLTVVDEDVQDTLPSGKTSPLAITVEWSNGEDGGDHYLGYLRETIDFCSVATRRKVERYKCLKKSSLYKRVEANGDYALYPSLGFPGPIVARDCHGYDYQRRIRGVGNLTPEQVEEMKTQNNWVVMSKAGVDMMFAYLRNLRIAEASYVAPH
jgi:hypothetical protein